MKQHPRAPLLLPVPGMSALEQVPDWNAILSLLYRNWNENRDSSRHLIRLALQCWMANLERGCDAVVPPDTDWQMAYEMMYECAYDGLKRFEDDFAFAWAFGYIMSEPWNYFVFSPEDASQAEQRMWGEKGIALWANARLRFADDPACDALFTAYRIDEKEAHLAARRKMAPYLEALFPGDDEMTAYFRRIYAKDPPSWWE